MTIPSHTFFELELILQVDIMFSKYPKEGEGSFSYQMLPLPVGICRRFYEPGSISIQGRKGRLCVQIKHKKNVGLRDAGIELEDKSQGSVPVKRVIKTVSEQPQLSKNKKNDFSK